MTERKQQDQDKFIVRLPEGMRDRIKAAAEANNRSMNAEIVATLEEKYPAPAQEPSARMKELFDRSLAILDTVEPINQKYLALPAGKERADLAVEMNRLYAELSDIKTELHAIQATIGRQ